MSDIFGRADQVFAGGLTSDASWMFWGGMPNGGLGMLVTQMQINYQQPVRRIFEIGPWTQVGGASGLMGQPVYYVAGRPEGTMTLSRIAGPVAVLNGFYRQYGSVCSYLNSLFFVAGSGCLGNLPAAPLQPTISLGTTPNGQFGGTLVVPGGGATLGYLGWYLNGVVITSIGLQINSQDLLVMENTQLMFAGLKLYYSSPLAALTPGFAVDAFGLPTNVPNSITSSTNWIEQ